MTVNDIVRIVSNRLEALRSQRVLAAHVGDLEQVARLDADIAQTQVTLDQVRALES